MAVRTYNSTLKGKFKPPRYRVFGLDNGVAFTRCYRTLKGVTSLKQKAGITHFDYVLLS